MPDIDITGGGGSGLQTSSSQLENIKVAVRLRPFTEKEKQRDNRRIVDIEKNTIVLYNPKHEDTSLKKFTFDHSYWSHDGFMKDADGVNVPNSSHPNGNKYVGQEEVFNDLGKFLLSNALEGYNSALLAYGQTGSGKSYTVSGYGKNEGILPRFARTLFEELDSKVSTTSSQVEGIGKIASSAKKDNDINRYEIFFSMIEIYNEVVRDLLAKNTNEMNDQMSFLRRGLKVREHPKRGFFVENLTSLICTNKEEIARLIEEGQLNKSIAATSMNETSSRGHTIYEFKIKQYKLKSGSSHDEVLTTSVVQLVDLAGSERLAVHVTGQLGVDSFVGSKTNLSQIVANERVTKNSKTRVPNSASSNASSTQLVLPNHQRRFKESVSINQSLSALGNCIQIMSQYFQQPYSNNQSRKNALKIPYRDSVLTKLLNRCCLSGNSKVVLIATLSPVDSSYDDTLSTLRFADRAKQIRTHAIINRMTHNEMIEINLKDNDPFKPSDGRITRSDDSSQTSNFDDTENLLENLTGRRSKNDLEIVASPLRSRTTTRRTKSDKNKNKKNTSVDSSSSSSSLMVREQMKRLVSPAQKSMNDGRRSTVKQAVIASNTIQDVSGGATDFIQNGDDYLGDVDLDIYNAEDNLGIEGLKEEIVHSDNEISSSDTSLKDMPNEDKIVMVNRMLSRSIGAYSNNREDSISRSMRPKKASHSRARQKYLTTLNSELKKTNPYLSNLNMDEQLSGVITYLIKIGQTIVGKDDDCDVVLRGTELRPKHAKISRVAGSSSEGSSVFIEPLLEDGGKNMKNVAVKVNGSDVLTKTQINDGDRIIFGTNSYFVLVDNRKSRKADPSFDPSTINYEFAKNEVVHKMMNEIENGAMIKEINDYTHRPGTGKRRTNPSKKSKKTTKPQSADLTASGRTTSLTRVNQQLDNSKHTHQDATSSPEPTDTSDREEISSADRSGDNEIELKEAKYRDKLMEDTYEFAIPVAEVNAIAKEMGIKITYSLKILTGEEQLPEQSFFSFGDSSASDRMSSSSIGELTESDNERFRNNGRNRRSISILDRLDALDKPPALFIRAFHEELQADFYWSKEKFQARRYKIMELYGAWSSGGKSRLVEYLIDQSKIGGEYMVDPFWDDPVNNDVLIGHSQITLKPIAHLSPMELNFDILNLDDETCGRVTIQAIPCSSNEVVSEDSGQTSFRPYNEEELKDKFLENPQKLLGTKLVFMLKIISCCDIPEQFGNVFCQYSLTPDYSVIRTRVIEDIGSDLGRTPEVLLFDHYHYICFDNITHEVLDFFEHGFLTIQVVGRYRFSKKVSTSQTVVTTIINSIIKYKYKLEQDSYTGINDINGSYYNSDSAHSNQVLPASLINSNSGASSVGSTSATVNMFDQQNEDDDALNGLSQENVIDMILTKRKLDRAENQLQYLKRTINIAEHYNKKHIPVKTVKKLLNSYGQELDEGSLEDISNEVSTTKSKATYSKNSGCTIQ